MDSGSDTKSFCHQIIDILSYTYLYEKYRINQKCRKHLSLKLNKNLHKNRTLFLTYHERCHMINDHYYAIQ